MIPVVGQPIQLTNGKYITPTEVSPDGTITAFTTNLATDQFGNPTSVSVNPGLTLTALLALLGVTAA